MKRLTQLCLIVLTVLLSVQVNAQNVYTQRFLDLREKMNDPANGYFSADGVPYHSVESLIAEAPDHGHETTSEAYSYWIWMEAMYGGISGDWSYLNNAWTLMETFAIPTSAQQPTTASYDPSSPATYAAEHPLPDFYPSALETTVPVGEDPVSADLTTTYGSDIYAMHWLFDCDNFYGYGNLGDGVSTPSYINTFQRGQQESVWETVPHPSWEDFSWGNNDGTGFLGLYIEDANPAKQWRYTNAPDADARAVQAMYWAVEFAKEQGLNPTTTLPTAKASKMGDFVRLSMFDKYFKPLGVQDKAGPGGVGYESAHYLMSWYFAWGGPLTENGWAWRIGSSHSHFGYQNPVAAYALSEVNELKPISATGVRDWSVSLQRQLEFYTWLQSAEGAIAGGATNCYNGDYEAYPAGTSTFYEMAYQEHPVYHDPGSNQWIGMQAWSMERIAELYYISGNEMAKNLLDNWVPWIESEVQLTADGNFQIPATLAWTGQPETWNPTTPVANTNLHVTVTEYGSDLGIAACLAKALTYYAAGTQKYGALDVSAKDLAQEILDRMWNNYYDVNGKGVAVTETRGDFSRFFDQEVFIPAGFTGTMANGDTIKPGVKFIDIRSKYRDDPDFPALEAAYNAGEDYQSKYHRYWAQADIALANAEFGRLFGDNSDTVAVAGIVVTPEALAMVAGTSESLSAVVSPYNATNKAVTWTSSNDNIATVDATGNVSAIAVGSATITATTEDGGFSDNCLVTITLTPVYDLSVLISGTGTVSFDPAGGSYNENTLVTLTATPGENFEFVGWSGDTSGTTNPLTINMDADKSIIATFTEIPPGCDNPGTITLPFEQDGAGEFCWVTTGDIDFVSSWNMTSVTINGTDFTNIWSNEMPEKINGVYNIRYVATVAWSHLEIAGTNDSNPVSYSLTTAINGQGSVSPDSGTYNQGEVVSITATPTTGWEFSNWSGDATGTTNPVSVTMDSDKLVTAVFTEITNPVDYTLVVTTVGEGSVSLDPTGGTYTQGTPVTLSATAAAGYEFSAWSGDATGNSNPLSLTMDANKVVTAIFTTIDTSACNFGTPLATALPSINEAYNNIHVIGNGPDLSNITTFTINWDLPNLGLYQLSMNTNNGAPNWYVDLSSSQTNSFNAVSPSITFTGTGITGLDGDYYAAIDNGNFVLDATSGAYSLYFSNSATSPCASVKSTGKDKNAGFNVNITLYPNPADDVVWLKTNNSIKTVSIYNLQGKQMTNEQFNSKEVEMNVNALQAGTYIIKVETENSIMTRSLIIE